LQNKEELVNTIQRTWKEVFLEMIEVFLASMSHCMKANGASMKVKFEVCALFL